MREKQEETSLKKSFSFFDYFSKNATTNKKKKSNGRWKDLVTSRERKWVESVKKKFQME